MKVKLNISPLEVVNGFEMQEIDSVFVKACQLKANYNLAMAKVMNPEYAGTANNNSNNNGVNLIINTGFKVNL